MAEKRQRIELDVEEVPSFHRWLLLSLQHLFAMFGATILVPYLIDGLEPSVALLTSGMGTLAILLFGVIALQGVRMMIEQQINFGLKRNLVIAAVILVLGIGGAFINLTPNIQVAGMALATIVGILLNLFLPDNEKERESTSW